VLIEQRFTVHAPAQRVWVFHYEGQSIMGQTHYDAPCSLPDTGQVTVLNYVGAKDCGNLIHPIGAERQVEGGAAQGIGYGLT
jgi:carbon monoxide dehydrogenase subunit G